MPAARGRTLFTVLIAATVVLAVLIPVVLLQLRGSPAPEPAQEPLAVEDFADAMAGAGSPTLTERVAPDEEAPLPDVTFAPFADGPAHRTTAYRGRPLVVNFWASWCGPCVEEMRDLDAVADELDGDVAFLGVNRADQPGAAEDLAARLGIGYDLATDVGDRLFPAVEAFGMPTTLLVDADGTIRYRRTGSMTAEQLRALLAEVLGVAAG